MDRRYTLLAILLIVLAAGLLIVPDRSGKKEKTPEKLLVAVNDPARFLSTDAITERIIGGDPTLQLIDVRTPGQFNTYTLPGAVNIQLDSLLSPAYAEIMKQPGKDIIFFSNDDVDADQAWQLCARADMKRIFVMKGGLNLWYKTIIKGEEPVNTASVNDLDLYSFRQSARQFFTGSSDSKAVSAPKTEPEKQAKVKLVKKPAEQSSGGGC